MTETEWVYLERYVREMADALGLRDFEIEIDREPCQNFHATTDVMDTKQWARVRVNSEFRTRKPEEQRASVLHEMLHVQFSFGTSMVCHGLAKTTGKPFAAAFYAAWHMADERAVDNLTRALSPRFPLPEWPAAEVGRVA